MTTTGNTVLVTVSGTIPTTSVTTRQAAIPSQAPTLTRMGLLRSDSGTSSSEPSGADMYIDTTSRR